MATEEHFEMNGVVSELPPDCRYRATLDNGHKLVAYSAAKMRKHHSRILTGDKVWLELSPDDLSKGRIALRHMENKRPARGATVLPTDRNAAGPAPLADGNSYLRRAALSPWIGP
jgi:translation initiation factor IF-1